MTTESPARPIERPRVPVLEREAAMTAAATEYTRTVALLESVTPSQWALPTDCPGWDVRAVAGHMLGMAQMIATLPALARQQMAAQKGAKKTGTVMIDVLTALQVAENAGLNVAEVVTAMRAIGPKAARLRRKMPAFIRSRTMPGAMTVGDAQERWTFGFLFDTSSSPATRSCTASTSAVPPESRPRLHRCTRASSSMTSSANGPPDTAAPTR
jgi:hypothetical protein